MKYSLKSSFARWVLVLFFVVMALTIVGRVVVVTGAIAYCNGFPFCTPSHPLGWFKQAHIFLVGVASLLMFFVLRKAWREQRDHNVLLPLTTILGVMFFGQALVGAMQVTHSYPPHLVFLHTLTTTALWVSLLLLVYTSGVLAVDTRKVVKLEKRQRVKDFIALSKPLIVGLLLITTYGGLVIGGKAWPSFSLTVWTLIGGALPSGRRGWKSGRNRVTGSSRSSRSSSIRAKAVAATTGLVSEAHRNTVSTAMGMPASRSA
jgi:heme A synthase